MKVMLADTGRDPPDSRQTGKRLTALTGWKDAD
jgi:hypothetical protein